MDLDAFDGCASSDGGEVRLRSLGEETRRKEKTICPHKLGKLLARSFSIRSVKRGFRAFAYRSSRPRFGELLAFGAPRRSKSSKSCPQTGQSKIDLDA
jgi:hypothetical protein